jgi:hypothetical protein
MGRSMRWSTMIVVLLGLAMGIGVGPASAHSNKSIVRLAVTADRGMVLVQAYLVYTNDHQPVRDEFVLAEVSGGGSTRGFQQQDVTVRGTLSWRPTPAPKGWIILLCVLSLAFLALLGMAMRHDKNQPPRQWPNGTDWENRHVHEKAVPTTYR